MKRIIPLLLLVCFLPGCRKGALEGGNWNPRVRDALNELIASCGNRSRDYNPECRPYAVFDYDNTTIVNDIAQTLLVYQIENLSFAFSPEEFRDVLTIGLDGWETRYPGGVTPQSLVTDLMRDYAELWPLRDNPDLFRKTEAYADFRAKLWYLSYNSGDAHPGSAFSCVWITTLLDGMDYGKATALTRESVDHWMEEPAMYRETWTSPDGSVTVRIPKGLALTPEMKDLYRALRENGIDVYICSASLEAVVEAMACDPSYGLGLDTAAVYGIRLAPTEDGTIRAVADSSYAQPYRDGKVQCIRENMAPSHGGKGPVLVAGDSNGDVAMLTAFKDLKLGLIVNCLGTGAIGGMASAAAGDRPDASLKDRDVPLYVVQGRDPGTLGFVPTWESVPVGEAPSASANRQDYEGTDPEECTSIVVGRLASADGSVITSHTCDGVSHTWISLEPAMDHRKGETFKVCKGLRHTRFKGDTTGVKIVGEIPEIRHTFAYVNTGYPSLNEKQVAIGETTFGGPDTLKNPDGMFLIEELARLALMRCDNAKDAVKLMGSVAERYGYGDAGECLTVADKREAWFFEILGTGKGRTGAVWAAQRVPDGEVAISANIPRIGKVDRKRDDFLCSDNVEAVAREFGLWDGNGDLIFWKAYNVPRAKGRNYAIREYFVLSSLAPSLGLSMDMDELPFSVKPEKPVDVRDVMAFFRSTYEGTDHDMSRNLRVPDKDSTLITSPSAHNWHTATNRNLFNAIAPGTIDFCRTLAVAWCSYSTVLQLRSWLPDPVGGILWYAVDNPAESPRIPIFCGNTSLPSAFDFCGQKEFRDDCILWQFRKANRLATVAWQTDRKKVEKNIAEVEDEAFRGLDALTPDPKVLNAYTARIYSDAASRWAAMEKEFWLAHGRGF